MSLDRHAMKELELYVDNDGDLYRQMTQPIARNLYVKIHSGKYDPKKAPKAWENLLEAGAKKYAREIAGAPSDWSKLFSKAERVALSIDYARRFERDVAGGEYQHLEKYVPKKYRRIKRFIVIPAEKGSGLDDTIYPIDTDAQHARARRAIRDAGMGEASVWLGDPEDPSSYRGNAKIRSAD